MSSFDEYPLKTKRVFELWDDDRQAASITFNNTILIDWDNVTSIAEHEFQQVEETDAPVAIARLLLRSRLDGQQFSDASIQDLVNAAWQVLDDMGTKGRSICEATKAQLRVAFEPFKIKDGDELELDMPFDEAKAILDDLY